MNDRTVPQWLTQWEYAHRGKHGAGVPENSLAAAQLAIDAGMGIECDIQRSADSQAMVFHDWDVERLTGSTGRTNSYTAAQLGNLSYAGSDEHPATLAQLFELIDGQVPLLIEVKSKPGFDVARSCAIVAKACETYSGPFAIMSFDPRVARWFRKHAPDICVGLVMREDDHGNTQRPWQRKLAHWIAKPDFLAYHIAALPSQRVARLRDGGLPILTWTVHSPQTRERALRHTDALIAEGAGLA